MKIVITSCLYFLLFTTNAQKSITQQLNKGNHSQAYSNNDTMQYAIGAYLALWMKGQGFIIDNPPFLIQGMEDIFKNNPRMIPDSVSTRAVTLGLEMLRQKKQAIESEQRLFNKLKERSGLGVLPNGIHFFIKETGQGNRPNPNDSVTVKLKGFLADSTVLENSGKPLTVHLQQLIKGLSETIPYMPVGSKWEIFIPSKLALGEKGVLNNLGTYFIPPSSALIYEVELLAKKSNQ